MRPILHWCSYWGTWSLVLCPYTHPDGVIELNLTPVNRDIPRSWEEQVIPIVFRYHGTSLGRKDQWGRTTLPDVWVKQMHRAIGVELTNRLLTTDWLPLLDIAKVKRGRTGGGGIPFEECRL